MNWYHHDGCLEDDDFLGADCDKLATDTVLLLDRFCIVWYITGYVGDKLCVVSNIEGELIPRGISSDVLPVTLAEALLIHCC